MDFGHLGFDHFDLENGAEFSKQKCQFLKQERAVNEDELRDFKTAKTTSSSSSCNEATLRFPIQRCNGSEGHQQMLSFSSPYSRPVNLPYYPHAFGRNTGGINGGNLQQGLRGLFTASQWMELEHQALIYKYISANVPIPSYLLNPIRKAFESAGFPALRSNSLGWGGFQLGFSNSDPEPGRCRRTDGKKWRCSRDAVADQKYCERHMNRGRHRSRKPVETTSATGNGKLAAATSATVVPSGGVSHRLPNLQPTPESNLFPPKHQESSFGLVCSDSLLNPCSSLDNLKTHLSIAIPFPTAPRISWEPSMGGPLGEVLHSSSTGECMNASTSPTGVLAFVSLSNTSSPAARLSL